MLYKLKQSSEKWHSSDNSVKLHICLSQLYKKHVNYEIKSFMCYFFIFYINI